DRADFDALIDALRAAGPELLCRYPDAAPLTVRLADRHGVGAERVLVTAGADEALDRVFRAFCDSDRNVVVPSPGFEMLPRYAALADCALRSVDWPGGPFPAEAFVAAADDATAVLFVVTPNNPTGAVAGFDDLARVAARSEARRVGKGA